MASRVTRVIRIFFYWRRTSAASGSLQMLYSLWRVILPLPNAPPIIITFSMYYLINGHTFNNKAKFVQGPVTIHVIFSPLFSYSSLIRLYISPVQSPYTKYFSYYEGNSQSTSSPFFPWNSSANSCFSIFKGCSFPFITAMSSLFILFKIFKTFNDVFIDEEFPLEHEIPFKSN